MKIKAKFKGSNSLGYVNGVNYQLTFEMVHGKIKIERYLDMVDYGICYYDSLKAFLNNWQVF